MLSPGKAFLLAYLPARRISYRERHELIDRNAATVDPALKHAIEFAREALKIEDSLVAEADARLVQIARAASIVIPASPSPTQVADAARSQLTTPVLQAAWKAGEAARRLAVAVPVAALVAYLRNAAAQNPDLRSQAAARAKEITESASALTASLEATGLPLVISLAGVLEDMVTTRDDLQPTTKSGLKELNVLTEDTRNFIESYAEHLDVPPPPTPTAPATPDEEALVAKIIANPADARLRLELAKLGAARNDQRAELIRLQLSPSADTQQAQIQNLIRSHPEWTKPLLDLGARDVEFAGGFPDAITIDAAVWLARGRELLTAAPIRRLKIRNAKGHTSTIVRSPLLATIITLDLDDQGVSDDDLGALAASSHAAALRQLDLRYNPISARGIEAIAASSHLKQLESVHLDGNPADPTDRQEYHDETNYHFVPTEAGKALEAKYGPLRWLRRG